MRWTVLITLSIIVITTAVALDGRGATEPAPTPASAGDAALPIWQTVGAAGTPDERSRPKVKFTGATAEVKSTGEVILRFNLPPTAVDDLVDGLTMAVRYRDNGSRARVCVSLCEVGLGADSDYMDTIMWFDSDDYDGSNDTQLREIDVCDFQFDFNNYVYMVTAKLTKSSGNGKPELDAVQIRERLCE
jgi:hypothetical protein